MSEPTCAICKDAACVHVMDAEELLDEALYLREVCDRQHEEIHSLEGARTTMWRVLGERDDARRVANWLKALLWRVDREGYRVQVGDIPARDWLGFDFEPEECP
jgi:hypothetical protein